MKKLMDYREIRHSIDDGCVIRKKKKKKTKERY